MIKYVFATIFTSFISFSAIADTAAYYNATTGLSSGGYLSVTGPSTFVGAATFTNYVKSSQYVQGNTGAWFGYSGSVWNVIVSTSGTTLNGNVVLNKVQGDILMGQFGTP